VNSAKIVDRVVKPQVLIQTANGVNFLLGEIETNRIKVFNQSVVGVALRDNREAALSRPAKENLGRRLAMALRDLFDERVLKQGGYLGFLPAEFDETGRTHRRISGNGDAFLFSEGQKVLLNEIRVMLDLERRWADAAISQDVHDETSGVVGNTDGTDEAFVDEGLEGFPGLLERDGDLDDFARQVFPAGRV
jgi:hypothetical protein